jgi:hypothetical protein
MDQQITSSGRLFNKAIERANNGEAVLTANQIPYGTYGSFHGQQESTMVEAQNQYANEEHQSEMESVV